MSTFYVGGSGFHKTQADQRCPVPWCDNPHDEEGSPHYSALTDVVVEIGATPPGHEDLLQVGLDEAAPGRDVMVCMVTNGIELWFAMPEARRLALTILTLDASVLGDAR